MLYICMMGSEPELSNQQTLNLPLPPSQILKCVSETAENLKFGQMLIGILGIYFNFQCFIWIRPLWFWALPFSIDHP